MQKQTSMLFCSFHEECPKRNLLWKFGLNSRLNGVLVTAFVSHSFTCFNDLSLGDNVSMATRMVSFDLGFCTPSEKVTLIDFQQGKQGFHFWIGIRSKNRKAMNHLKAITVVSMETKVLSSLSDIFWSSFLKNFTWRDSEKGNRVFSSPLPLGFWSSKKACLGWG